MGPACATDSLLMIGGVKLKPSNARTLVVPATRTPEHWLSLSNLDRVVNPTFSSAILFYNNVLTENDRSFGEIVESLKQSLGRVLVDFYPLAGRLELRDDGLVDLHCNDQGAVFLEALLDAELTDVDGSQPMPALSGLEMAKLGPGPQYVPDQLTPMPALVIQVSQFRKCGSVALAVNWHHTVADGFSGCHFMQSWAEVAMGKKLTMKPDHNRELLRPRTPLNPSLVSGYSTKSVQELNPRAVKVTTQPALVKSFPLNRQAVQGLKALAKKADGIECTSAEAVSGFLWQLMTKARMENNVAGDEELRSEENGAKPTKPRMENNAGNEEEVKREEIRAELTKSRMENSKDDEAVRRDKIRAKMTNARVGNSMGGDNNVRSKEIGAKLTNAPVENNAGDEEESSEEIRAELANARVERNAGDDEEMSSEEIKAQLTRARMEDNVGNDEEARHEELRTKNTTTMTRFFMFVDGRKRLVLPAGYFGNVVCSACAVSSEEDIVKEPLSYAADLIRKSTRSITGEYFRSLIDWVEEQRHAPSKSEHVNSLGHDVAATFWTFFRLYDMDFGWGKPSFAARNAGPRTLIDGIAMMPSPAGPGHMVALLNLHADRMSRLQRDPTFSTVCPG